jgi:acetyltransferase-like isoleucine patch superfamily enzyme
MDLAIDVPGAPGGSRQRAALALPLLHRTPENAMSRVLRLAWALATLFVVESVVFGLAVAPAVVFWRWHFSWQLGPLWVRALVLAMAFVPAYLVFAAGLIVWSSWSVRLFGWRTPRQGEFRLDALEWPLLDWVRYLVSTHVVRVFVGSLFRATPVWTWYLRMNGARVGQNVYVNSLAVSDHSQLEFGDHVVIGDGVHLSGHTVEAGLLKTAPVRLGAGVTIGLGSVIGIGVTAGDRVQVGALSLVPKFATLEANTVYAGIPVRGIRHTRKADS